MEGSIRVTRLNDKTVIKLDGILDQELALNLASMVAKTEPPIVLNLKQVPYLTVPGSQAILSFYQQHRQKPELQDANSDVISLLKLTGASAYITLLPHSKNAHGAQE